jgi:hypothetical protein
VKVRSKKPDDSEKEKGQEAGDDSEGESEPKSQKEKGGVFGLPSDNPLYNLKPYMRKLSDWDQRLNRLE